MLTAVALNRTSSLALVDGAKPCGVVCACAKAASAAASIEERIYMAMEMMLKENSIKKNADVQYVLGQRWNRMIVSQRYPGNARHEASQSSYTSRSSTRPDNVVAVTLAIMSLTV